MGMVMQFSDEMLFGPKDPRPGHLEAPASEEMAAFEAWKAKFKPLYKEGRKHGWFRDGGPDYGFEYTTPEDRWVYDDEENAK